MQTDKEFHQSSTTSASGTISAVIENLAENPLKEFFYDSDSGEPLSMKVTGKGTHTSTTKGSETINGKLISADERTDHVSGSALPKASIQFNYSDDYKTASIGVHIIARGTSDARRYFDEWKDYGGPIEDYGISCSGGCSMPDDKNCKIHKTGKGYSASWSSSENKKSSSSNGMEYHTYETSIEFTIVPYKESDKPVVTIDGCKDLGVGETGTVTATAKPDGGTYKFWVEPSDMMTVSANGAEATITGKKPGHGVLMVEYTTPDEKTDQTSAEASCVSIESYNGGEAIPQIALFDIDGKKKSGILTVPVEGQPENATELVKFEPANPGVLTAVGVGSEVTLQGITTGKTTLQAKTKCGAETGPAVEVEVVNCDDETIARLEKMKKAAIENLVAATKDMQQHAGSKEFEKARDDLVSSAVELLAKVGLTIIANGKTSGAVKVAADIADNGSALSEIIASSNPEELKNNIGKPASGKAFEKIVETQFGKAVGDLWGKSLSAGIGVAEVGQAADRFYNNVGELYYHEELLEKFLKIMEKAETELKVISSRQQLCKGEKTGTPQKKEPKTEPKPDPTKPAPPTKPTPPTEKPTVQEPQTEEPVAQEAQTEEPPADDDIIGDPEPPVIPPRQVGLPYEPDDCGCSSSKNLTVSSKDFSTLGAGIKNLGECVENFKSISLTDYQKALTELSELTESLSSALQTDALTFLVKAKESKPQLDAIVLRVKAYDEAGKVFLDKMGKCPETVSIGMEIFKSVETITVDSIKTNY